MAQQSIWQEQAQASEYAELCSALYEREISLLSAMQVQSINAIQGRLKSLPYYVQRTAHLMLETDAPLELDYQNAAWASKQARQMPESGQSLEDVWHWYQSIKWQVGLIVPVKDKDHIVLDCVDRIDSENNRFRTNIYGWFSQANLTPKTNAQLFKPNKKVMMAACAGHRWQENKVVTPIIPSMRELLLSCTINWRNFKRPVTIKPL